MYFCSNEEIKEFYSEFGATEESIAQDVKYLIEWMEKQPHLPNVKDELMIKNFLLRSKNQMEKTKSMLDRYYCSRVYMKELFWDRDPHAPEIKDAMNFASYVPMSRPTPDGYRVIAFRFFGQSQSVPSLVNFMKAVDLQVDLSLRLDQTRGTIFIYDYENITANAVILLFSVMKKCWELGMNVKPIRTKKIYILNLSPLVEPLVRFSKSLVKKEIGDRIEIWKNNATDLADVIPKSSLSCDYGGTDKSLTELRDEWYQVLLENTDWFVSEETVKGDPTKKPNTEPCKDISSFGIEGSFRKIAID